MFTLAAVGVRLALLSLPWRAGCSGTEEDNVARKIGHRLHSKWADSNAMGLIVAEVSSGAGVV